MEIIKTTNYHEFGVLRENRSRISEPKFNKLKKNIDQLGYLICPIIAVPYYHDGNIGSLDSWGNELCEVADDSAIKYVIIDGQHRLKACSELEIEATVVINPAASRNDIKSANNSSSPWSLWDYVRYNALTGDQDSLTLWAKVKGTSKNGRLEGVNARNKDGWDQANFSDGIITNAFYANTDGAINAARNGNYKIDVNKGTKILETCNALRFKLPKYYKNQRLVRAISYIVSIHPTFRVELLLEQLKTGYELDTSQSGYLNIANDLLSLYYSYFDKYSEEREPKTEVKQIIRERDGDKCQITGRHQSEEEHPLEFDHKTPWNRGGRTTISNLQLLTRYENRSKSDNIE